MAKTQLVTAALTAAGRERAEKQFVRSPYPNVELSEPTLTSYVLGDAEARGETPVLPNGPVSTAEVADPPQPRDQDTLPMPLEECRTLFAAAANALRPSDDARRLRVAHDSIDAPPNAFCNVPPYRLSSRVALGIRLVSGTTDETAHTNVELHAENLVMELIRFGLVQSSYFAEQGDRSPTCE